MYLGLKYSDEYDADADGNADTTGMPESAGADEDASGKTESTCADEDAMGMPELTGADEDASGKTELTGADEDASGKTESTGADEDASGKTELTGADEDASGKTESTGADEDASGKPESTGADEDASGKTESTGADEDASGKTESTCADEDASGKTESTGADEDASGKTESTGADATGIPESAFPDADGKTLARGVGNKSEEVDEAIDPKLEKEDTPSEVEDCADATLDEPKADEEGEYVDKLEGFDTEDDGIDDEDCVHRDEDITEEVPEEDWSAFEVSSEEGALDDTLDDTLVDELVDELKVIGAVSLNKGSISDAEIVEKLDELSRDSDWSELFVAIAESVNLSEDRSELEGNVLGASEVSEDSDSVLELETIAVESKLRELASKNDFDNSLEDDPARKADACGVLEELSLELEDIGALEITGVELTPSVLAPGVRYDELSLRDRDLSVTRLRESASWNGLGCVDRDSSDSSRSADNVEL
ncbi:hypothetical protein JCM33374_g2902 [Metschnikowia sp. JCM 33374]|nr:hypothetical protein JCM33374_g2902 [Metschnikowia sp. JCM 33374]